MADEGSAARRAALLVIVAVGDSFFDGSAYNW
jgi:hypothetical protein